MDGKTQAGVVMRDEAAIRETVTDLQGMCSRQGYADAVRELMGDVPALLAEVARNRADGERLLREAETWHKLAREEGLRLEALRAAVDAVRAVCDRHWSAFPDRDAVLRAVAAALSVPAEPAEERR